MGMELEPDATESGLLTHRFCIDAEESGKRLDVLLHAHLPDHSRSYLKDMIKNGHVLVDGKKVKPSLKVAGGEDVEAILSPRPTSGELVPQELPLEVLHEDASIIVLNKAQGMVVHPGNGRQDQTMANALAFRFQGQLSDVGGDQRPGIVHRLDRDTTGVMVVAKTNRAHYSLGSQFQERTTKKEYLAIVDGSPNLDGDLIDLPLGRNPKDHSKIAIDEKKGKSAQTRWEVEERFDGYTLMRCHPRTGRTHQIRVHLQSLGHPIACDSVYGRRKELRLKDLVRKGDTIQEDRVLLSRHALHAHRLSFTHPLEGRLQQYEAPLPQDMNDLLEALRRYRPL